MKGEIPYWLIVAIIVLLALVAISFLSGNALGNFNVGAWKIVETI